MRWEGRLWRWVACGVGLLLWVQEAWAQTPDQAPFVAKRLFVPAGEPAPTALGAPQPAAEGLIVLTGIMVLPDGKRALLEMKKDSVSAKEGASKAWWREGENVGGYVLEAIEPAAVVLASNQQKVRIPLYGTAKERPQPVTTTSAVARDSLKADRQPAGKDAAPPQQGSVPGGAPPSASPGKGGAPPGAVPSSPPPSGSFKQSGPETFSNPSQGGEGAPSFANPFLEALRKARQGQGETSEPPVPGASTGPAR